MKEGWIQVTVPEGHPRGIFDLLSSILILLFALPLIYLTFSLPIYFRASYTSLQLPKLLTHFILTNVLGYLTLAFVAIFNGGEPAVL